MKNQFRLSIGAKRQLTLPAELLEQLRIPSRGELMVEVIGDHAILTPMVSVPRAQISHDLRRMFESRRGARSTDMPLEQFLTDIGFQKEARVVAPENVSQNERVISLTPNEQIALGQREDLSHSAPFEFHQQPDEMLEATFKSRTARRPGWNPELYGKIEQDGFSTEAVSFTGKAVKEAMRPVQRSGEYAVRTPASKSRRKQVRTRVAEHDAIRSASS